jgi:hypothetical protein
MQALTNRLRPKSEANIEEWLAMAPNRKRFFTREEEFLNHYHDAACAAVKYLRNDWCPNPSCDDQIRKQSERLYEHGELKRLVFDCAFVDQDGIGEYWVQMHLKASNRRVVIRVKLSAEWPVVETLVDRAIE